MCMPGDNDWGRSVGRVLIIDDDALFSLALGELIRQEGHEAAEARTLAQGMEEVRKSDFDLIILDVQLPDGNGLDLLPKLKSLAYGPEVIIITSSCSNDGAELAIQNGAWDYIEKTDTPQSLRLSFLRALDYQERKLSALPCLREGIIGSNPKMLECVNSMARAARSGANVLIYGETGTGKELFARAVHANSPRSSGPFVIVDCASIQESIMASELFGHRKGAFTGATMDKPGLVLRADGGTLFLDEVSELAMDMQKSFLRVLETRSFRPVGDDREVSSDFRLVCACNKDLQELVAQGRFREDLYYRIKSALLVLPPLRERADDLPQLVDCLMTRVCRKNNLPQKIVSPELLRLLSRHPWPGNIRELANVVEALVASAPMEEILFPPHLPRDLRLQFVISGNGKGEQIERTIKVRADSTGEVTAWSEYRKRGLENLEERYLSSLMNASGGDFRQALTLSGLSQARLYSLLRKHNVR
ncbi:MAG: sigma-54 dependent transcriptional regulator [Desulfocurvibacter africanus]